MDKKQSCCGQQSSCGCGVQQEKNPNPRHYITGSIQTPAGNIPIVKSRLQKEDRKGGLLARWTNRRMDYRVEPGLYGVGKPNEQSPVMVSANYKLSFDHVRKELNGIHAWILVLDTKGINVWCAAGKGSFGTHELINRVKQANLHKIVSHKKLILPQLGAPGVAGHTVTKETGFRVIYGPVYAKDIPLFLENNLNKTPEMRRVNFTFKDRSVLVPMELIPGFKLGIFLLIPFLLLDIIKGGNILRDSLIDTGVWTLALLAGALLTPLFLPFVPGRSFTWKGWLTGVLLAAGAAFLFVDGPLEQAILLLFFPPMAAYLALNFTGSTTFTSLSGVVKEMRIGIPLLILSVLAGLGLKIYTLF